MSDTHERAIVEIDGVTYRATQVRGVEEVSTLYRYDVTLRLEGPSPKPASLIGADASLTLITRFDGRRTVNGIVAHAHATASEIDQGLLRVELRPAAFAQTLGRDSNTWQESTVPEILADLLSDYPAVVRWELSRPYERFPYRAQYREDDWTYASRLCEEQGIYYWFDHDEASALVFADRSSAAPPISGLPVLRFAQERALYDEPDVVKELGTSVRATPGRFSIKSFDPDRPAQEVVGAAGDGPHEIYDARGGGPRTSAGCTARAQIRGEAAAAARRRVRGAANSVRLYPGRCFEVIGHPLTRLDGRYFVVSAEVRIGDGVAFHSTFQALRLDLPFRPAERTPEAKQAGLQLGVVVGPEGAEVHPDEKGRIRVQLHWDRLGPKDETAGTWMRVAQRPTPGSMLLPRMGWNVATFNEEGSVDAPSILCRIHDAEHPPAYGLPDNKTRTVYKTATTPGGGSFNEIRFEDKAGAEEMLFVASRDMSVKVQNVKSELVGNEHTRKVGLNHDLTVMTSFEEVINGDQTVTIGANQDISVTDTRTKDVSGNDVTTIGGSRNLKAGHSLTLAVEKNRTLKAPIVLDVTLGTITSDAQTALTLVGGAMLKASAQSIDEDAPKLSAQAVGGAKLEISGKGRALNVDKTHRELVGGAMLVKTNSNFVDTAEKTHSLVVGVELSGSSKEVFAEAQKTIRVKCGASVLTLTEDEISLEAPKLDLSGAHIEADTKLIERN